MPGVDNIKNCIKIFNEKKSESKDIPAGKDPKLGQGEKLVYHIQLYVRDYSNMLSNQFVRIFISEKNDKFSFFKNLTPAEVLKKADNQKKLSQ